MRLQAKRPVKVGERLLGGPTVLTCVPLLAADRHTLLEQGARLGALRPDCIEWRADFFDDLEPGNVPELLDALTSASACPLLFTNRLHDEGGHRPQDEGRRAAILEAAASTGVPAMVDVELATDPALARTVETAARRMGVAVVRSWHDFSGTPSEEMLRERLRAMLNAGADVAKVAVTPRMPEDVLALLGAGLAARRTFLDIPCVLMSMGALGGVSRFGGYFGSDLTFAVGVQASAPGQMDLDLMRKGLRALGLADAPGAAAEAR
ncbi:MAG: type I 3-dehydroquinate dehydratase [Armatimonadota bacterium]|nr:type I 3-dehydroquinate dehydratase [Armatimonadota bacterium]